MKVSYNWLKEYVKDLPKPEKLADLLTMHAFEVEGIEKMGNDYIFDIDILPNRAHDCLSHIGVAREVAALTNSKLQVTSYKLQESKLKVEDFVKVEIKDSDLCPRYTARVITDIKVGPSPKWLQERLRAVGQQSINNIIDATNYVAFETGQPLHAFDANKLAPTNYESKRITNKKQIIIRRAKKGEKITTLDGEECKLDNDILVIADSKDPIAVAGIKGGKKAEIDKNTKTIILESANFNLNNIHASSRKLGISTESSLRFEHGLDPNLASEAMDRLAELIQKNSGGKIAKGMIDVYPHHQKFGVGVYSNKIKPRKISLKIDKVDSVLGVKISEKEIIRILNSLGFKVKKAGGQLFADVPTRRLDIEIPEDLIEEIGRIYGYEKISSKPPIGNLVSVKPNDLLMLRNKAKNILDGLGMTEVYNYSFIGDDDLEKLELSSKNYIELENPLSLDLKYLRRDLITNLLKNIRENFKYFDEAGLFELGKIYFKNPKLSETMILSGVLGKKDGGDELFYEAKGVVDGLLNKLGISNQWYDNFEAMPECVSKKFFHPDRAAEVKLDNQEIGFIGEINPAILSKFKIKGRVAALDIDFELLIKLISEELIYSPSSKYPAVVRDIAILVNLGDKVVDVLNAVNSVGGDLIQDIDLFDMYEGGEIPRGKKNLAFHIIYQSDERTLTDKEVDKIHDKIVREASKRRGWEVRK